MISRGVPLSQYSDLEQIDFIEAERQNLLIEFGRETVRIMSSSPDRSRAMALIEQLKKIYFIGYEEQERRKMQKEAEELVKLSQMTFRVTPKAGGGILEIGK